jgi:LytR cell envelope-related transcriptional attenuator
MSNEQPSRSRRSGSGASPMGSTLAIVIAIAAVIVAFLILRNIRSDSGDATTPSTLPTSTTVDPGTANTSAALPTPPQSTVFQPTTVGAKVLVANSSHADGVAKVLSTALAGQQFQMGTPTNGGTKEAVTKIQYKENDPQAQQVAQSIAQLMGVASIEVIPTPVALGDPTLLADNTVVVLLGDDKAGKTLAQMTEVSTDTTPSSAAGATSSTAAP